MIEKQLEYYKGHGCPTCGENNKNVVVMTLCEECAKALRKVIWNKRKKKVMVKKAAKC